MQSGKFILRNLSKVLQAPAGSVAHNVVLPLACLSYPKATAHIFAQKNMMNFSTLVAKVEERQHKVSEAKLLLQEFNLITRNQTFNKNIVIHTIERYMEFIAKQENAFDDNITNSQEFQNLCDHIARHLNAFDSPSDLANILLFLLRSTNKDSTHAQHVLSFIRNYKQALTLPIDSINEILSSTLNIAQPSDVEQIRNIVSQIKKSRSSVNVNDYIKLLETARNLLSDGSIFSRNEEFLDLITSERSYIIEQFNNLTLSNLLRAGEFLFENQQGEQWLQYRQKVEKKLLEGDTVLGNGDHRRLGVFLLQAEREIPELWGLFEEEVLSNLAKIQIKDLIFVLGSFAAARQGSEDLYMEIDRRIGILQNFVNPEDFPNAVYYFASGQKFRTKFFYMASEKILSNINIYSRFDLIKSLWAFVHSHTLNTDLLNAVQQRILTEDDNGRALDENCVDLLSDCIVSLQRENDPLIPVLVSGVKEILENGTEIRENLLLQLHVLALDNIEAFGENLVGLNKYIQERLREEVDENNAAFFVQFGEHVGKNFEYFSEEQNLLKKCMQKLEQVQKDGKQFLDEDQLEQAEFTLLNLRGIESARH